MERRPRYEGTVTLGNISNLVALVAVGVGCAMYVADVDKEATTSAAALQTRVEAIERRMDRNDTLEQAASAETLRRLERIEEKVGEVQKVVATIQARGG